MPTIVIPTKEESKPFYEQVRKPLPEKVSSVLTANNIRVGAGNDIFAVGSGGFVFRSTLSESTVASGDFGNGDQVVNQVKVTQTGNKNIIAIVERAVYAGTDNNVAYLLPGGASIDESQFQVIGSNFSIIDTAGATMGTNQLVNHLYIRNISAGAINLYIDVYVRYIINTT